MMRKHVNHALRMGMLCLLALSAAACQSQKPGKPAVNTQNQAAQPPSEEVLRKQREAEQLRQCQEQLGALRTINETVSALQTGVRQPDERRFPVRQPARPGKR